MTTQEEKVFNEIKDLIKEKKTYEDIISRMIDDLIDEIGIEDTIQYLLDIGVEYKMLIETFDFDKEDVYNVLGKELEEESPSYEEVCGYDKYSLRCSMFE